MHCLSHNIIIKIKTRESFSFLQCSYINLKSCFQIKKKEEKYNILKLIKIPKKTKTFSSRILNSKWSWKVQ
jgi:hypothetical protein